MSTEELRRKSQKRRQCVNNPSLLGVCGDAGYRKTFELECTRLGRTIDISERIKPEWEILPKRWRVERTFAWLNPWRRLSKDYEVRTSSAESFLYIAHFATLYRFV
ncbi:hypothetical protein EEL31_05480 [Brevibacillus laterosporus]|nr:transposase [Brevibacillus laterosporus]TPG68056.1 hypothetical protein EEL31_05480 [Brevibacillus laterosporus]